MLLLFRILYIIASTMTEWFLSPPNFLLRTWIKFLLLIQLWDCDNFCFINNNITFLSRRKEVSIVTEYISQNNGLGSPQAKASRLLAAPDSSYSEFSHWCQLRDHFQYYYWDELYHYHCHFQICHCWIVLYQSP